MHDVEVGSRLSLLAVLSLVVLSRQCAQEALAATQQDSMQSAMVCQWGFCTPGRSAFPILLGDGEGEVIIVSCH
jgi:hypothetical protein